MTNIDDELDKIFKDVYKHLEIESKERYAIEAKAAIKQLIEAHTAKAVKEARIDELDNLPSNVAELREYLPKRNAELRRD